MQKQSINRITELDILRAFAIFAVILIHTISGGFYNVSWSSHTFKIYLFLDQFSRFCVPLFVFLSGFTLTLRYKDRLLGLGEFFKKRVFRLVPWYLFWSAVLYVFIRYSSSATISLNYPLWKLIFLGRADYHLYFVPMIFSLYVLFPLLAYLTKKYKLAVLLLLLAWQICFYFILSEYSVGKITLNAFLTDQQQYIFFGTWIFYFVLGIFLALESKYLSFFRKYRWALLFCILLALLLEVLSTFNLVNLTHNLTVSTRSTRIPVLAFASTFCVGLIVFSDYFSALPKKVFAFLVRIGQRSYVIYLCHTLVLRVFVNYIHPLSFMGTFVLFFMVVAVSNYLAQLSLFVATFTHEKFLFKRTEEI